MRVVHPRALLSEALVVGLHEAAQWGKVLATQHMLWAFTKLHSRAKCSRLSTCCAHIIVEPIEVLTTFRISQSWPRAQGLGKPHMSSSSRSKCIISDCAPVFLVAFRQHSCQGGGSWSVVSWKQRACYVSGVLERDGVVLCGLLENIFDLGVGLG